MAGTIKRALAWLLIAFIVYTVLATPHKAADMARATFGAISTGGQSLAQFFNALA
ncbi:MAG: hypothetical protein QOJ60_2594 [Actinomycetota bacterium]|jgi:hypothetical protein|nr:hypothetical protein [Actinomycetota bacterium]